MFQPIADIASRAVGGYLCRWSTMGVTCWLAICLAGCGSNPYQPMSGEVTVDGEPLPKGVITFYPIGDGTTVGGEIIDGTFDLSREQGASPGNYRVEIVAFRPSGRKEFDVDLNEQVDIEVQYLPPKYNAKSTLQSEVIDSGPNHFTYELVTR